MRNIAALFLLLSFATPAWSKPNFVVIMTDDQEDTGSMAYMPKVHALLAERGITFTDSFVSLSLCCPSRVSFLTGQAPHNHGIKSNSVAKGGGWQSFRDKEENALPVWLKSACYNTALIGKYLNGYGKNKPGGERQSSYAASAGGAKHMNAHQSALDYCIVLLSKRANIFAKSTNAEAGWVPLGWDRWFALDQISYYNYRINDNGTIRKFGRAASDYSTDVLKDRALQYIKDQSAATEPFFLLVATKAPHGVGEAIGGEEVEGPATPSPNYAQKFLDVGLPTGPAFDERDVSDKPKWVRNAPSLDAGAKQRLQENYRAELQSLQSVDDLVDAIVKALQGANKLDDTIIIFTSDNGFLYGDHRLESKIVPYEGSIKVPLVIRGPGIPKNQTRSQLVNNLDLVATIEDLAGATAGLAPDGHSLVPLFAGDNASWRAALLVEGGDDMANPTRRFAAVRTATRKYVKYDDGFEEFYDLTADPYELENKAGDAAFASDLTTLRSQYEMLKSCAAENCWIGP